MSLPLIVDCHVHTRPVADYLAEGARLLDHMRGHGIAMMLASDLADGWPAFPDAANLRNANARLRELVRRHPGEIAYLVYLNPQLDDWREELARHRDSASGIKLWTSLKDPATGSLDNTLSVLREAARLDLTVLIHCLDRTDPNRGGEVGLEELIGLARAVPDCRIVGAHSGGNWRKAIALKAKVPDNLWFDVSGSYPERTMVRRLADAFGAAKVLYGSDAPGRSFGSQLAKILTEEFPPDEAALILADNARKLFRLAPTPHPRTALPALDWQLPDFTQDHFCFAGEAPYWDHKVSVDTLLEEMRRNGIKRAYPVSLDAVRASERVAANRAWRELCRPHAALRPLAAIDPRDRAELQRQLNDMEGFAGLWISPYLHDYRLDDPALDEFFRLCTARQLPLWLNTAVSDDRFRSPALVRHNVTPDELAARMRRSPEVRCCVQGLANLAKWTREAPSNWMFECSKLSDGEYLAEEFANPGQGVPARLVFGSEYPFRAMNQVVNVLTQVW